MLESRKLTWSFFVVAVVMFTMSCQHPSGKLASIRGNLTGASGFKLVLQEMDTKEIHAMDSVIPGKDGKFSFSPLITEPGFWLLKSPSGKIMVLLLNAGDEVELSGNFSDFPDNVLLKGPGETMLLNDFFRRTRMNERKVDSLEMLLVERQDSADYYQLTQKLDTSFKQIWDSQRSEEMKFIDAHPGSLASLVALNYAFGMSPVLSLDEDYIYYQKLDSVLFRKFPDNKHVKFHHQRVAGYKRKVPQGK